MAAIDYTNIKSEIKNVIESNTPRARVLVEREIYFGVDEPSIVAVYMMSRSVPADRQKLAAGTRGDFTISFLLRCVGFDLESTEKAAERRDSLLADVEIALMGNRDLNGKIEHLFLGGGDVIPPFQDSGFVSVGDIQLEVRARAIV